MIEDRYKKAFLEEAFELVENTNQLILKLEKDPKNEGIINELFRYMHSLKSEAGLLGFNIIMDISHFLEDIFDYFRKTKKQISKEIISTIFKAIDFIFDSLNSISSTSTEKKENSDSIIQNLKKIINDLTGQNKVQQEYDELLEEKEEENEANLENEIEDLVISKKEEVDFGNIKKVFSLSEFDIQMIESDESEYFLINISPIESCIMKYPRIYLVYNNLKQIGEVVKSKPNLEEDQEDSHYDNAYFLYKTSVDINSEEFLSSFQVDEIGKVIIQKIKIQRKIIERENEEIEQNQQVSEIRKSSSNTLRIDIEKLDSLGRSVGELITNRAKFEKILEYTRSGESLTFISQKLEETSTELFRISDELQSIVMQLRMIPVNVIFNKFPRVVRDIASKLNKDVDFFISGGDTEIDKKVIEEIQDPITHLIRNAIDHGIEPKEERIAKGKPAKGRITLSAYQEGSHIIIEVSDDGSGVNYEKIAKKLKKLYPDLNTEVLTQSELIDYLFKPGFTTKDEITTLSGRGVGLDVVKEHVSQLRGRIDVTTEKDIGTSIKIILPLTLTILEVLMVKAMDSFYAIPIYNIEQTDRIPIQSIEQLDNYDILQYRNEVYSVIYLSELVGKEKKIKTEDDLVYIVIVRYNRRKICILIDELIGEQDVVVQSLDEVFKRIKGISGVAILGDGSVALILDIPEIVKDFVTKNSSLIDRIEQERSLAKVHDEIVNKYKEEPKLKINENNKKQIFDDEKEVKTKINEQKEEIKKMNEKQFEFIKPNNDTNKEITELSILDLS
ncbi:MAG: chemotaxis protein CheA [Spirochaetales bacterium]|nr:chemotaxis protein CheA [Exilispira sp.]NMC66622.1 chemotaxis protein CheA [Spirochaetales bacterium]